MVPSSCSKPEKSDFAENKGNIKVSTKDLEKCGDWIKARALEKVCLQFPDYLLAKSASIALRLEEILQRKVYILGDTTCGSCCIDEVAANHIGADGIIHFGHACLNPTTRLPVFHILPTTALDIMNFSKCIRQFFTNKDDKILLFYDVTYAHLIETIWESLSTTYPALRLTFLNCTSNVSFVDLKNGENFLIVGRTFTLDNGYKSEDYQALFLGTNSRTLASLAMSIPCKSWYYTEGDNIHEFEVINSPWLKRRRYLVEKLKDAKTVGIVVATLGIKDYLEALSMIKKILKEKKKKTYMFSVGKPNPMKLANFPEIDAFIVIACPENDIFESRDYHKPLLTPYEVELAFNNSREYSTHYCLDFRQILPGGANYVDFEATNNSDLSLLTGEIRNDDSEITADQMKTVACKNDGTIAIGKAGADFLIKRSWQGLEQRLGETEIKPAELGRRGLPINYDSEPISKDS